MHQSRTLVLQKTTYVLLIQRAGIEIKIVSNQVAKIKPVVVLEIKTEDLMDPAEMAIEAVLINSKNVMVIVVRADIAEMMIEADIAETTIEAVLINSKNVMVIVVQVDTAEMMIEADIAETTIEAVLINSKNVMVIVVQVDTAETMIEVDIVEIATEAVLINSKNAMMIVIRVHTAEIMTEVDIVEIATEAVLINSKNVMMIVVQADTVEITIEADIAEMMIVIVLGAEMMLEAHVMIIVAMDAKECKVMILAGAVVSAVVQDTAIDAGLAKILEVKAVEVVADLVEMTKDVDRNRGSALVEGRHKGTYLVRSDGRMNLATENLVPGNTVYKERLVTKKGIEYRTWDPFRSKLAASIKNGLETFPFKNGSSILYLGVSSGTTASHISDIVGPRGIMFCVEHASRVARDFLDRVASYRKNIVPILQDARRPGEYSAVYGKVDIVYADIAQPDQTQIVLENCQMYLKDGGVLFLVIKTRSIDVVKTPHQVVKEEREKISRNMEVLEVIDLLPYDKDHAMIIAR